MKAKTIKLFVVFLIIFSFSLQNAKADVFSTTKFYLEWDSSFSGTPDEFTRIHDSFIIKNPNLSGLNDENIAKKSEKEVEEVFKKVTSAKAQYEKAKNPKEKFVAQKILYNWTTLYNLHRTLVKPPKKDVPTSNTNPKEDYRVYGNDIKPFRNFKIIKSEMTNDGFIIEFEYTYDEIEFYSSIKGKESDILFHRRWVLGSIHPEFLSNDKPEGYIGGNIRPDKSGARIKRTSVESDKYYLKNHNQITNSYINSYAPEYAQKFNFNWPPNANSKFTVCTFTDKWQWKPIVKANFENKYLIKISNMFGKCLHEELITLKTGSDIKNAKAETKTIFDSEKIIWATFGILSTLGLIGYFKTKIKPIKQNTEKTENTDTNENESEDTKDRPAIIFNTSGCSLVIKDGGQNVTKFTAKVVNSKLNGWKLTATDNSGFLTITQTPQSAANQAEFAVNTVGVVLNDNEFVKDCLINISAVLGTETIYAAHKAVVGREGLFVISQKPLKINADGTETSELALTATRFENSYLVTDQEALTNTNTIFEPENDTAKKAFETAIVDFGADSEWRDIRKAIDSYQTNNVFASRVFKICTKNALPSGKNDEGSAKIFAGKLTIRSSSGYEQIIRVEMSAPKEPTRSELLEQEYKNCRLIIEKYVPAESGYQEKFYEMTDKYGRLFGPEGLFKLRHDIWAIAQKLWEAKGLQGYCEMAERLETYDKLRSWTEWTGDMALSVLLNLKTGGGLGGALSQTGIMLVKQMTVSAINHYKDTIELKGSFNAEDCESWLNNQLKMQLFATPDYMLTAASLKGFITPGRAAALMFANVFLRSLIMNFDWAKLGDKWDESGFDKESCNDICKAAWIASKESFKALSSMMLTVWLTGAAVKSAIKNNTKVHDDVLKQYAPDALRQAEIPVKKAEIYDPANTTDTVNTMVANIRNGKARPEDVVKCLADNKTQAMRTIKSLPQNVQKAFMETLRKEFYEPHDKALIKHLEAQTNVPWGTKIIDNKPTKVMIKIFEMSTPGKKTVFSQDRDFCPKYYDIKTEQWLEIVPAKHWKGVSDTWWKNKTGIKAELLQQAAMTRLGDEACPDYATQTLNQSTGLYEVGEPNIVKVYAGKAKLKSPIELAAMYKKKIDGPLEHNNIAESIAQLKKGVQVYDKLVKGYQKQGLLVKSPEPKFRLAMEIISWAPDDYRATPDVIQKLNNLLSTETDFSDLSVFSHDLIMRLGNF